MKPSGLEIHIALGIGEHYHSLLHRVCNMVRACSPQLSLADAVLLAMKAVKDTAEASGALPTFLVFGFMALILVQPNQLPAHAKRMKAMKTLRNNGK